MSLAALPKALPATDDQGRPVLAIALERLGDNDAAWVWLIDHEGSIAVRDLDTITVDWIFAPVEGEETEEADQPEGVPNELPDVD